jgi:hypothetical protein
MKIRIECQISGSLVAVKERLRLRDANTEQGDLSREIGAIVIGCNLRPHDHRLQDSFIAQSLWLGSESPHRALVDRDNLR